MTHRTRWPVMFTLPYAAKRAGITRFQLYRVLRRIPAGAAIMRRGRWTRITLAELQHVIGPDAVAAIPDDETEEEAA